MPLYVVSTALWMNVVCMKLLNLGKANCRVEDQQANEGIHHHHLWTSVMWSCRLNLMHITLAWHQRGLEENKLLQSLAQLEPHTRKKIYLMPPL